MDAPGASSESDEDTAWHLLSAFAEPSELDWLVAHPSAVLKALAKQPYVYLFPETLVRTVQRVPSLRDACLAACETAMRDIDTELDAARARERAGETTGMDEHFLGNQWCAFVSAKEAILALVPCSVDRCQCLTTPPGEVWHRIPPVVIVRPVCEEHACPEAVSAIQ